MAEEIDKKERNRRLKLGIGTLILVVGAYILAKVTNDQSGDWYRFSIIVAGVFASIGGYITLTDLLGKKF